MYVLTYKTYLNNCLLFPTLCLLKNNKKKRKVENRRGGGQELDWSFILSIPIQLKCVYCDDGYWIAY